GRIEQGRRPLRCPRRHVEHPRSEEHTSELQSHLNLVCRLLLEKKKECPAATPTSNLGSVLDALIVALRQRFVSGSPSRINVFFFFNDTATTEIYTLSLHDALPI